MSRARPFNMRRAQAQARQPFHAQNAVEALHGNPAELLARLQPDLANALQEPLDASCITQPTEAAPSGSILWISQTFNNISNDNIVQAFPNRKILIIQNLSATNNVAINFDQLAVLAGGSPVVSQGILLVPGATLYIDRYCPTNTIHINSVSAPVTVTQGFTST